MVCPISENLSHGQSPGYVAFYPFLSLCGHLHLLQADLPHCSPGGRLPTFPLVPTFFFFHVKTVLSLHFRATLEV